MKQFCPEEFAFKLLYLVLIGTVIGVALAATLDWITNYP